MPPCWHFPDVLPRYKPPPAISNSYAPVTIFRPYRLNFLFFPFNTGVFSCVAPPRVPFVHWKVVDVPQIGSPPLPLGNGYPSSFSPLISSYRSAFDSPPLISLFLCLRDKLWRSPNRFTLLSGEELFSVLNENGSSPTFPPFLSTSTTFPVSAPS